MHAYNRMEADQTDSIAVCATPKEWQDVVLDLIELRRQVHYYRSLRDHRPEDYTYELATVELIEKLEALGVDI